MTRPYSEDLRERAVALYGPFMRPARRHARSRLRWRYKDLANRRQPPRPLLPTPTLVGVLGRRRKPPQLVGRKVRPHRHRCRHGTNPPAPSNQLNIEREIASESERKAVGISSTALLARPTKTFPLNRGSS